MSCPDPMYDYADWTDEDGQEWIVDDLPEWDPIMGDADEYPETDDEWLDDFQGEEEFA
jgi:hypothetical protein